MTPEPSDHSDKSMLGWLQDWSGVMYNATSANRGAANRYWSGVAEPEWARFVWNATSQSTLGAFNATPGEEGGVYLTTGQRDAALAAVAVPTVPEVH